jgi:hypothetical protein
VAVTGKLADSVIKIALAGYDQAKAQLTALKAQLQTIHSGMAAIGSASSKGFALATGSITGFLKAADPVRFEIFTQKIQILSMYIGLSFIPILDRAIKWLDKVINYFKHLTDEQREQILHWTELAVKVLAAGVALGVIATVLPTLITLVKGLAIALKLLTSGPVGALIVGVVALALAFNKLGGSMSVFGRIGDAIKNVFEKIGSVLSTVFAPVFSFFGKIWDAIKPIFETIGNTASDLVTTVTPYFTTLWELVKALIAPLQGVASAVGDVLQAFGGLVGSGLKMAVNLFGLLLTTLAEIVNVVLQAFSGILTEIVGLVAGVGEGLLKAFGPALVTAVQFVADVCKTVLEVIKGIVEAAKELVDILDELNPFSGGSGSGVLGTALNQNDKSTSSGGDFGGGDDDETKPGTGKPGAKFSPLARPVRVEQFGLEEAFKKAQQGASFDPAKLAENERKKLLQDQLATQKAIEENTRKRPAALSAQ